MARRRRSPLRLRERGSALPEGCRKSRASVTSLSDAAARDASRGLVQARLHEAGYRIRARRCLLAWCERQAVAAAAIVIDEPAICIAVARAALDAAGVARGVRARGVGRAGVAVHLTVTAANGVINEVACLRPRLANAGCVRCAAEVVVAEVTPLVGSAL